MINFGEVPAGAVLPIPFAAYAAATGASVTLTGLAVSDIEVYKGTSMTQRASDNGYALMDTDGIDLDGITGIHGFSIDTSDNSDASFYAVGSYFTVIVSAVTIDGQTVNFIAATFRIKAAESAAGVPKADVSHYGGSAGTFSGGRPEVNTTHAAGTAWNSGAISASTLAADTITAAKLASDVTTELQTGLATAAALATVAGYVDTEIADIQSRLPAALVGGRMACDVIAISGDTTAADNLETSFDDTAGAVSWMGIIDQGTAQAATGTTLQLRSAAAFANDEILGAVIVITGGSAGVGQSRVITDYVSSTDTATVDTWTTTPTGTITYKILAAPPADSTAAAIKAVTDKLDDTLELTSDGYVFSALALEQGPSGTGASASAIADEVQTRTIAAVTVVNGLASNSVTAAALAADAVTEIQNGLATAAALDAVDNFVDTEVTAIKAVTDKVDTMLGATSDGYAFTANALELTPSSGSGLDAAGVRSAIGLGSANLDTQLSGIQSDTNDIQTRLPAALVSGRMDSSVGAMAANTLTASALATDAVTEIQSGLATAAALATVDSVADAIQAKTDNLPSDPADASDIAAAVAAIQSDTNDIQSRLPAALVDGKMDSTNSDTVIRGTVNSGASTTSIPTSAFSPAGASADQFKGRIVVFDNDTATAALRGEATDITASSNSATPTLTVTALSATPASGDTFSVL